LRPQYRAASLTFHGAHAYLTYFPYFPFPWYFPATTLFAALTWGGVAASLLDYAKRRFPPNKAVWMRAGVIAAIAWILSIEVVHTTKSAHQWALKQLIVDDGNLRRIGEWLKSHAAKTDYVFMEPLGYIGYFSQLRAYDYPGLSSPKMVATRKKVGNGWAILIKTLLPEWVVLRPHEVQQVSQDIPGLLSDIYEQAEVFDVTRSAPESLLFDAYFTVYRRKGTFLHDEMIADFHSKFGDAPPVQWIHSKPYRMVHAPGSLTINVPSGAHRLAIEFGFVPDAWVGEPKTDGVLFDIVWDDGGAQKVLASRFLNPVATPGDRTFQQFELNLPPSQSSHPQILLRTSPGETETKDWSCWGGPEFK